MSRALSCLALFAAGCVVGPRPNPAGIPSPVRASVAAVAWPALARALEADGFETTLAGSSADSRAMAADAEEWDEASTALTFTTRKDGEDVPLSTADMASVLRSVRAEVRRAVLATPDAEYLDWTEGEGYRERTLVVSYRVARVFGSVRFRLAPATGRPEELAGRLEVTVREQPVP